MHKKFLLVLATVVAAVSATTATSLRADPAVEAAVRNALTAVASSGPAANWSWTGGWNAGPTCVAHDDIALQQLAASDPALADARTALQRALDATVAQLQAAYGAQLAVHAGVVYDGEVLFSGGAGTVRRGSSVAPTGDTVFSMGSVTKIFTTLGLLRLAEEGVVALDEPVSAFFSPQNPPAFAPRNPYGSQTLDEVNLHSLAQHTSGLTREPAGGAYFKDENVIMQYVNMFPLMREPLTQPHYSNLGMGLLGRCLERAVQTRKQLALNFEDWSAKYLLEPLGMGSSGWNYTAEVKAKMAMGYTLDPSTLQQVEYPVWATELGWAAPCGGLYTTTNDMLSFIERIFGAKAGTGPISAGTAREYALPGISFPDAVTGYGLAGWEQVYANGFWTLTKGGLVGGFGTSVAIVPELRLGVVCWINLMSGTIPDVLAARAMSEFVPALLSANAARQPAKKLPANYEKFLGSYSGTTFTLSMRTDTKTTGIFSGMLLGYEITAFWDPTFDISEQSTIGMRYRLVEKDGLDSCFILAGLGDNAVALLSDLSQGVFASLPDQGIYSVPKDK